MSATQGIAIKVETKYGCDWAAGDRLVLDPPDERPRRLRVAAAVVKTVATLLWSVVPLPSLNDLFAIQDWWNDALR